MSGKKIDLEQVAHVARLARIAMDEEELASYGSQLDAILAYVEKLNEIDTAGIEPTAHITRTGTPMREDVPGRSFTPDESLANAPERQESFFQVPQVIE
ncbi:MAG: Asp-tRNA(Asn)/Glu-tRNA(Gln) amidotransferase subunit GatC [Deltaproteobacteria bacterium]|nr:Asp-tRNA(Asn)/Glu-tRNA(Gln) amidotransferase subunit GatC [Deltaproteobacteria bacterium]